MPTDTPSNEYALHQKLFELHNAHGHPVKIRQQGSEWVVGLSYPEDSDGHLTSVDIFWSKDKVTADNVAKAANKILDGWLVGHIWKQQFGK